MQASRPQFTIRQLMIGVASAGLLLALTNGVMRAAPLVIGGLEIALFTSPLWGSIGLTFVKPSVTRWMFLACCLVVLPVSGCCFVCAGQVGGPLGGEWMILGMGALWILVPFGFGDVLSKDFHAWRAKKHEEGAARALPSRAALVNVTGPA